MRGAASGAAARVGGLARRRGLSDGSGGGSRTGAGGGWDRSNLDHTLFFFARLPREQHTRAMWFEEAVLWGTCCQRARAADAVRRSIRECTALTRFATPTVSARAQKGVFAATGSSASRLAKHVCSDAFGLEGSLRDGPWSYRGAYAITTLPLYTAMLVGFGTAARRGAFFRRFAHKMWARMLPGGAA